MSTDTRHDVRRRLSFLPCKTTLTRNRASKPINRSRLWMLMPGLSLWKVLMQLAGIALLVSYCVTLTLRAYHSTSCRATFNCKEETDPKLASLREWQVRPCPPFRQSRIAGGTARLRLASRVRWRLLRRESRPSQSPEVRAQSGRQRRATAETGTFQEKETATSGNRLSDNLTPPHRCTKRPRPPCLAA